ncbi:MAG: hypothetical protein LBQ68_05505 [Clostridiales bacterium]|jgi:flagellar hook-associated protein 1 FlgK|nr:hypothetical protein [Clostridiales bacterium]
MGMMSLNTAVGGLNAAQTGLYVTGHNMANSSIQGYSRQRHVQADYSYNPAGFDGNGSLMQKGLGAFIKAIRQIRSRFLDAAFRTEESRLGYYKIKSDVGVEVENVLGETQSQYNLQSVILDMWNSLNELSAHPEGLETRVNFISTANAFVTKTEDVYNRLFQYQHNLDRQIRAAVTKVNDLVERIQTLSIKIAGYEAAGDNANDYRDERNLCLDELSEYITFQLDDKPDGSIGITAEGKELLSGGVRNRLGLKYLSGEYDFVEPVFTKSTEILGSDTPLDEYQPLFVFKGPVNADYGNDNGILKGLMISRGTRPANFQGENGLAPPNPADPIYPLGTSDPLYIARLRKYENDVYSVNNCFIPMTMRDMDVIVHGIVTMINDRLAPVNGGGTQDPNAPFDLTHTQPYMELFSRKHVSRWDGGLIYNSEDPTDFYSLYTSGNLMINPKLVEPDGHNRLALSISGDREDNLLILDLIDLWSDRIISFNGQEARSINDAYKEYIAAIGTETREDLSFVTEQELLTQQVDDKRGQIMGVSLDEEMKNMMIYQHAYGSAAKILNVIDSMLDRLINLGA